MRVAITLEQCWHRVPGGTATSILGLTEALAALAARPGAEVEPIGVAARHSAAPPLPFRPTIPVRHLPLPRLALYEAWHGPGPLRWPPVQRATGAVDVVHATAVAVPPAGWGRRGGRGGRAAPLVMTIHDLAFLAEPSAFTKHGLRFFRRGTELARRQARVVVVPSQATADECVAAGFAADRVRVVPWGHDARPATADEVADVRRRHGLPERYVLFVGTLEPRKNLRRLLDAFSRVVAADPAHGDVALVLAGPDGWGDAGVAVDGRRVRAVGFVSGAERDALYAGAAAVAYPSLREGFGLPVLEAMAQGAPVLTSKGTATEEVAGDAAVLVDPLDVDAIAAGLAQLLDDPAGAAALGDRARQRAAAFTWSRCADGYVAAYRDASSRRSGR